MSTTNQGMSFAEIEQIVAQRVANAIETIAIYEAKTCVARDLMNRLEQQEGKISKKAHILELKRRNLKDTVLIYYTPYPSRKIRPKLKVIKEGFEKLGLLKINDDSFAYDTSLGIIYNEFNRLSGMDDDLFTCEVEIPGLAGIPCDSKEEDDSDDGDLDIYELRTRGNDEMELTDEKFSNPDDENLIDKDEVAEIFRIETNIFDFETPICKAFNEFNYFLKIDTDILTSDIPGFKTHDEFKDEWMWE
ncbi:hypothetical protein Tco_0688448 [Tanacetum coccineum]